ncbi:MAG: hypothetical protein ACPGJV_09400 [Bacteriovoracaceae bacterium]
MQKEVEVKLKKPFYIATSLLINGIFLSFFVSGKTETIVFLVNYAVILLYQYILVTTGKNLVNAALGVGSSQINKGSLVILFMTKLFIIFFALSLSVQFIGNKIILPLLNYVIHLFLLAFALWDKNHE